ncbi:MAG: 2-oxo acid dehydrogenase subunit E2 [Anaerolineae bacterium]|nr:2-oxo acid dehydrogenase subunit E2 [Anaerolineae bacterium]
MTTEILMPKLGLTMTEGTIQRWLIQEGQAVRVGTVLFEIETEKATNEIEAQVEGILARIVAHEGEIVPVGQVVGYIVAPGHVLEDGPASLSVQAPISSNAINASVDERRRLTTVESERAVPPTGELKASPAAKRVAKELDVDLARVQGSGPGGRILEEDVRRHAERARPEPPASPSETRVPFTGVRRLIADRMVTSLQTSAQVTLMRQVDATLFVQWRNDLNAARSAKDQVSFNDLLAHLVARALHDHPAINGRLENDTIVHSTDIHIGIAVDTDRGLVVPVIKDAGTKNLDEIVTERNRLIGQIQQNRITPDELSGSTFTISNLGALGVDAFTPVLNPPECGILGVGRIIPLPVVMGEPRGVVIRERMTLSLTFDHRLVDGAPAARFLARVTELIEQGN